MVLNRKNLLLLVTAGELLNGFEAYRGYHGEKYKYIKPLSPPKTPTKG